jgi:hypothetical protein
MFKCPDPSFHPPPPRSRPHCPTNEPAAFCEEVLRGCCSGFPPNELYEGHYAEAHMKPAVIEGSDTFKDHQENLNDILERAEMKSNNYEKKLKPYKSEKDFGITYKRDPRYECWNDEDDII